MYPLLFLNPKKADLPGEANQPQGGLAIVQTLGGSELYILSKFNYYGDLVSLQDSNIKKLIKIVAEM